jgi:hypothetical protein
MLTDEEIDAAKTRTIYTEQLHHEHNDCIRMAYEWLDAQTKLKAANRQIRPLKHIIEHWAGRYISRSDVDVAGTLHPEIIGKYPYFNLSAHLVRPNDRRLEGIGEALSQGYRESIDKTKYTVIEA